MRRSRRRTPTGALVQAALRPLLKRVERHPPRVAGRVLATEFGLLPLALGSGQPGREIESPMATIIVGGLVTSTVLNLVLLPTILLHYGKFAAPAR